MNKKTTKKSPAKKAPAKKTVAKKTVNKTAVKTTKVAKATKKPECKNVLCRPATWIFSACILAFMLIAATLIYGIVIKNNIDDQADTSEETSQTVETENK